MKPPTDNEFRNAVNLVNALIIFALLSGLLCGIALVIIFVNS